MNGDEIIKELESLIQKVKQESKDPGDYFLKFCPFCKASAQFDYSFKGNEVRIVCESCKCSTDWFFNKGCAVNAWNERV